jgi:hypothetical protein
MSHRGNSLSDGFHNIKGSILNVGRIRDSITARREKEILETNYAKRPLTHRNVETLVEAQRIDDACNPLRRSRKVQISEWLQLISSVRSRPSASCAEQLTDMPHLGLRPLKGLYR